MMSSQIFSQCVKISERYGLKRSQVMNHCAMIGFEHIKDWDIDQIVFEAFNTAKLKYLIKVDLIIYEDRFTADFFNLSKVVAPVEISFSRYFALCVKYGLSYLKEYGVDKYFDEWDLVDLLDIRIRLRLPNGNINRKVIVNDTIDVSMIGEFDEQ